MNILRNKRLVAGLGIILVGLGLIAVFLFHVPSREITRVEMEQLLASGALSKARITPTPYPGMYQVEAVLKPAGKSEKLFITTHLDEPQVKKLLDESGVRVAEALKQAAQRGVACRVIVDSLGSRLFAASEAQGAGEPAQADENRETDAARA